MRKTISKVLAIALVIGSASVTVSAQGNPEQGDVELSSRTRLKSSSARSSGGEMRLAMQGRIDAANIVQASRPDAGGPSAALGQALMVPVVTPGVRLLDGSLFVGLGLGFAGKSSDGNGPGDNDLSQGGFSLVPTATFDLVSNEDAALSLGGTLTLASLSETESCDAGGCMKLNDDAFAVGFSMLAGIRGKLTKSVSIGTEFGWGLLSISTDNDESRFVHGLLGMLVLEASIGL